MRCRTKVQRRTRPVIPISPVLLNRSKFAFSSHKDIYMRTVHSEIAEQNIDSAIE